VRDVPRIAALSIALASYEAFAIARKKPTITDLSNTFPWSLLIYGWLGALAYHFWFWSHHDAGH